MSYIALIALLLWDSTFDGDDPTIVQELDGFCEVERYDSGKSYVYQVVDGCVSCVRV